MPITYYVYEDDATNQARVRSSVCHYVVNRVSDPLPDNRWLEFGDLDSAKARAGEKADSGLCASCFPG